ncbi:MAG: ABC transporter permease [Thermoprotei archaeon]
MNWLRPYSIFSILILVLPVALLVYEGFGPMYNPSGVSTTMLRSIELSFVGASTAALLNVILFTPLAYYVSRRRDELLASLSDIPASIPHPIVGIALLLLDSPITPIGKVLLSAGINFFDTYLGFVSALTIISAPIYVTALRSYFDSMNRSAENFAASLGARPDRLFSDVVLPNSYPGIVNALLTSTSRALSEFGSVAIVAYYVLQQPFYGVESAPVKIYELYGYSGLSVSVTASALMIGFSLVLLVVARLIKRYAFKFTYSVGGSG